MYTSCYQSRKRLFNVASCVSSAIWPSTGYCRAALCSVANTPDFQDWGTTFCILVFSLLMPNDKICCQHPFICKRWEENNSGTPRTILQIPNNDTRSTAGTVKMAVQGRKKKKGCTTSRMRWSPMRGCEHVATHFNPSYKVECLDTAVKTSGSPFRDLRKPKSLEMQYCTKITSHRWEAISDAMTLYAQVG